MGDAGNCRCAAIDERAAEAWIAFLNRAFSGQTIGDAPLVDLSVVREADTYLRGLALHLERFDLDEVVRHTRAIFEHPLRSAYPVLFPPSAHTHESRAPYVFKDLTYGTSIVEGRGRVFITNQLGELISCDVVNDKLEPWSIKTLGLAPHEFLYLTPYQIENVRTVFTSELFQRAAELRTAPLHSDLPSVLQDNIRALAELPRFLADCATNGCGPEGFIVYLVPNLAYEECCNAHDICYAKGGTEDDRARCDEQLARCIDAIGGGGLAPGGFAVGFVSFLYYTFVTIFGTMAFSYGSRNSVNIAHRTRQGHGGGGNCSYAVKLLDINVRGADDQRIDFEVIPDQERQTQTNPGMLRRSRFPEVTLTGDRRLRFSSDPLTVKYGQSVCGTDVTTSIFVNARQLRKFLPDTDAGKEVVEQFRCDGSTYDFSIEVSLSPATVTFNFIIETTCGLPGAN